jgi:hypothetical protein
MVSVSAVEGVARAEVWDAPPVVPAPQTGERSPPQWVIVAYAAADWKDCG